MKDFFEKVDFQKSLLTTKKHENYSAYKELKLLPHGLGIYESQL